MAGTYELRAEAWFQGTKSLPEGPGTGSLQDKHCCIAERELVVRPGEPMLLQVRADP